jgi:hypothetical protein
MFGCLHRALACPNECNEHLFGCLDRVHNLAMCVQDFFHSRLRAVCGEPDWARALRRMQETEK